ncbi:FUSC family protein [Streptomyces sp. HNM0574]|uniref:FUSC family protein n=1 Tax=Streptomyces sp. HNM0574 TaxID=2714954 RepID=UPI0019D310A6|nr:FUSC family protein [Streptomyces sp. HNM0574]
MGKHARSVQHVRPLPLRSTVRLRRPLDIWHKHAFSAVVALAIPDLLLLALGRLDLIMYTSAGGMCALYAHGLPYRARARAVAWVVLGMVGGLAVALLAAAYVDSAAVLVLLASLVAAVHKMVCDATRIGPPANVVLTFIAASAFFVPQRPGDIPLHVLLALGGGVLAWLVCMAPGLVRPQGPERIATARALEAAAALLRAESPAGAAPGPARHGAAAAVNAAWHTLSQVSARTPRRAADLLRLESLLVRAESALAAPHGTTAGAAREAGRCAAWARELRGGGPLPAVALDADGAGELAGLAAERAVTGGEHGPYVPRRPAAGARGGVRGVLERLGPGSPLLPVGVRVAAGCALAGWASMALGVGHPYWAVVTAASVFQANTTLTWQRAVQRTLGNLLGVLLFTLLLPVIQAGPLAMVLLVLLLQIGAEAFISRNYWLGSVCVTPMALLLSEFGGRTPAGQLVHDRWVDTVIGAVVGLLCCLAVTNRRAAHRIDRALDRVEEARAEVAAALAPGAAYGGDEEGRIRDRLAVALVELREAADVAAGEWWQRELPEERLARAEREGHIDLARLVRRLTPPVPAA